VKGGEGERGNDRYAISLFTHSFSGYHFSVNLVDYFFTKT
jgi:hypothetical protein